MNKNEITYFLIISSIKTKFYIFCHRAESKNINIQCHLDVIFHTSWSSMKKMLLIQEISSHCSKCSCRHTSIEMFLSSILYIGYICCTSSLHHKLHTFQTSPHNKTWVLLNRNVFHTHQLRTRTYSFWLQRDQQLVPYWGYNYSLRMEIHLLQLIWRETW